MIVIQFLEFEKRQKSDWKGASFMQECYRYQLVDTCCHDREGQLAEQRPPPTMIMKNGVGTYRGYRRFVYVSQRTVVVKGDKRKGDDI